MITLYHYIHCPYCVRVRMAFGYLGIDYRSEVLRYDDEKTPVELNGKKLLPIVVDEAGNPLNESLDIIEHYDKKNVFGLAKYKKEESWRLLEAKINDLGSTIHSLAMPYWVYTKEFDQKARDYFMQKKQIKRGPFRDLFKKKDHFMAEINGKLSDLAGDLAPFYQSDSFRIFDIVLASHLWGLYVVCEFQFSKKMHSYLQEVKRMCQFSYHEDLWDLKWP